MKNIYSVLFWERSILNGVSGFEIVRRNCIAIGNYQLIFQFAGFLSAY